ncbi:MAG: polysaccharide deacetylase family protein [bacterium]
MTKVLAFHKLLPGPRLDATNFSPLRFRQVLRYLKGRGWHFVQPVTGGEATDDRGVAITFDDGYRHLSQVLPAIIDEFGLRPMIFVPTAWIGKSNQWDFSHLVYPCYHLTRRDIGELASCGALFGSHGHQHVALDRCSREQLHNELVRSRQTLQDITGAPVNAISYPFGRCDRRVLDAAASAGYTDGFTMNALPSRLNSPLARPRTAVYAWDTLLSVKYKLYDAGPAHLERFKSRLVKRLAGGTVRWQHWRGRQRA